MKARAAAEDGLALVVAIMTIAVMLTLGLATYSYVAGQEHQSTNERVRESSFNLAEAALNAQIFRLAHSWPGSTARAHPASCTQASSSPQCPDPAGLRRTFDSPDFAAGSGWVTSVRDNSGPVATSYADAPADGQPTWDSNADGRVWVRAQALVGGQRRTLASLARIERFVERFPKNAITAGRFATSNRGSKIIVDTRGQSAEPAAVAVRCNERQPSCLDYDAAKGQVSPDTTQVGYAAGAALEPAAIERLRARAVADGTYFPDGCPPSPAGAIVFVERGDCSYTNSVGPCCNSATAPGVFILMNGTLSLGGNIAFHGIVYAANAQASSGAVVSTTGTAAIQGSVAIDGAGLLNAGSSKVNIVYDERVFGRLVSYGSAALVENTWREIRG